MRILGKRKPKKLPKLKKGVIRITAPNIEDLAEEPDLPILYSEEDDDDDLPDTDFVTEYVAKSSLRRKTPKIIDLEGLDPEKAYGVECHKRGTFNVREIRPALGSELEYYWRKVYDFGAVSYFPSCGVREGFRLVRLPNGMHLAICSWRGEKYIPRDSIPEKKKLRLRKEKHGTIKSKSSAARAISKKGRIKIVHKKIRIRLRKKG